MPNHRNFRAEAVDVEDPFVNVPDSRGEMVIVCDDTDLESRRAKVTS